MKFKEYELLDNGRLDDNNLKSEYERGYVDCWNNHLAGFAKFRTEEPLKGWRQWCLVELGLKAERNGVI